MSTQNFFQFAEMICEQHATFSLGSLDVYSLLNNILLNGTIDVCVNQLFGNTNTVESFTNSKLKQLCLAIKETFFMLNYLLYKQIHDVAKGAHLGPSLLNAFVIPWKNVLKQISPRIWANFLTTWCRWYFYTFQIITESIFTISWIPVILTCHFFWKRRKRTNCPFSTLNLYANRVNLQTHFIENLLLVAHIVTLEVFQF